MTAGLSGKNISITPSSKRKVATTRRRKNLLKQREVFVATTWAHPYNLARDLADRSNRKVSSRHGRDTVSVRAGKALGKAVRNSIRNFSNETHVPISRTQSRAVERK